MFRYMPFLVFFSHLSSLLSSSLKRLGSSSFSRISSHCLWYCSRGFSGKEVWSAFTPPSRAPPWQVRKWKIPGRVTRPAHSKSTLGTTDPRWLRPTPTPPSRPSESPGSPIQISVVLFPSSQWQALLWEATLSRVEPWASLRCVEKKD